MDDLKSCESEDGEGTYSDEEEDDDTHNDSNPFAQALSLTELNAKVLRPQ